MLTKIEQYAIDRVRDRRNQLGLTQDDLNNLLAFAKAMKCSPRVFLPEDTSNF